MKATLLLLLAIFLGLQSRAFAHSLDGIAGVCLDLNATGQVVDARIVKSSGNTSADKAILQLAYQLHWDKPYPPAGWMGIALQIGSPQAGSPTLPNCETLKREGMI